MAAEKYVDAAVLAHDLRNLLQIVGSALYHIDRQLDGETRSRVREFELAAAESLARAGVLSRAFVAAEHSSPTLSIETISPGSVILEIRSLIELTAGPSVQVSFDIEKDVPSLNCSRTGLECAVLNLISNARDAMPEGGVIDVTVAASHSFAVIRVQDEGCGMSAETAAIAFQPFFSTKEIVGGSGLGLAMVARFAEQAGGCAKIESIMGVGTTVILRLPGTRTIITRTN